MEDLERKKFILYINENINELTLNFRKEILQMILCSDIDPTKIVEKGSGTQIKYENIEIELLKNIYNYIYNKIEGYNIYNENIL